MTLQQLRYAVAIVDHKSMNKAAAELFITQPGLSHTIKDLENEIHTEIFKRSSKGIVITPEGEEFLGYARQMLDHYRLIEERYGDEYAAVPLKTEETMTIGYSRHKRMPLSILGQKYIEELKKYEKNVL